METFSIFKGAAISMIMMLWGLSSVAFADKMDAYQIGQHGQGNVKYPDWFKNSFYDLQEDLNDARRAGKRGIIVFFSQKNCNHCQAFMSTTLSDPATQQRVQKSYDVVGLDIFNDIELTDFNGSVTTIKEFAETSRARLVPTLIFYGVENAPLVKIIGFYPPEKFNQVLDYIEGHHYRQVKLSHYLRSRSTDVMDKKHSLNYDYTLFVKPPHELNRVTSKSRRPLLVVFENPDCNPCERFHKRVLSNNEVRRLLLSFDAIQLDMSDNAGELTVPDGRQLTPKQWANELQLNYEIAVVFFDENGNEVHRLDAETGNDRMAGSMQYVLEKAYTRHEQFLRWRRENALNKKILE